MILHAIALLLELIFPPLYMRRRVTRFTSPTTIPIEQNGTGGVPQVNSGLETLTKEWYVAAQDVTIDRRLRVSGTVNLILCNGAMMTVNGGIMGSSKECMRTIRIYGVNIKASGGTLGAGIGSGNRCDRDF